MSQLVGLTTGSHVQLLGPAHSLVRTVLPILGLHIEVALRASVAQSTEGVGAATIEVYHLSVKGLVVRIAYCATSTRAGVTALPLDTLTTAHASFDVTNHVHVQELPTAASTWFYHTRSTALHLGVNA